MCWIFESEYVSRYVRTVSANDRNAKLKRITRYSDLERRNVESIASTPSTAVRRETMRATVIGL